VLTRPFRLFVAAMLSPSARREVEDLLLSLKKTDADLRWVTAENAHWTLKFLGNVEEGRVDALAARLREGFAGDGVFQIRFSRLGVFPNERKPGVLWLGAAEGGDALTRLAEKTEVLCEAEGFARESRVFSPHLTLARAKEGARPFTLQAIERCLPEDYVGRFQTHRVEHVCLYQSKLTAAGPAYDPLLQLPLMSSF